MALGVGIGGGGALRSGAGSCRALGLGDSCFDPGIDCGVVPDESFGRQLGRRGCAHLGYLQLANAPQPIPYKPSLALGALLQKFASRLPQIARYWRANSFE